MSVQRLNDRLQEFSDYYRVPVERLFWYPLEKLPPFVAGMLRKDFVQKCRPITNRGTGVEGDESCYTLYQIIDDSMLTYATEIKRDQASTPMPQTMKLTPTANQLPGV